MKWYIGQEIVSIKDHTKNVFKKGEIFIIKALRTSPCCKCTEIDIGFIGNTRLYDCVACYTLDIQRTTDQYWFHEKRFAPLDSINAQIQELLTQHVKI